MHTRPERDQLPASTRPRLTLGRITDALQRHGYSFVPDDEHENSVRARFDSYPFTFMVTGEHDSLLLIRGRWDTMPGADQKLDCVRVCNHWNMERMWPKVYVRRENDEALGVYGETVMDFRFGVDDAELDHTITTALSTIITFFHNVEEEISEGDGPATR
ncbi:YbjN domain-containing protein [Helcobacillus massiliensis]|uniref:YbjN domain-containing protein n=1 Tax=Helcobacillus massiliensis TaxID=521392 RepID=UPI0021A690CE|nr:YbjN domain-containing protein [Helcobacillus massiliensis]MCT1557858.1 YbjN domain-containing protein [Helcobacillus massiliensis]MCT2036646.1 YbjN domain-containing protein [Helcobacillus massiliensis]MCT2332117.1 YbjN domain-containing protein [Helcobacillus massiliensis]